MKGINFITNEKNKRTAIVINLKDIAKHEEEVHELIDEYWKYR